jgi:hypothetical protein
MAKGPDRPPNGDPGPSSPRDTRFARPPPHVTGISVLLNRL